MLFNFFVKHSGICPQNCVLCSGGYSHGHHGPAWYRAAQTAGGKTAGAIALPRTELHLDHVRKIECALQKLKLEVFWVDSRRRVTVASIWPAEIRP